MAKRMNAKQGATVSTLNTEPMASATGVTESARKMSFGAGTANQMKLGSITNKKRSKPHGSKPKRYCFSGFIVLDNHKVVIQPVKQTLAPYSGILVILSCSR